jgi:predicted methyltransferase
MRLAGLISGARATAIALALVACGPAPEATKTGGAMPPDHPSHDHSGHDHGGHGHGPLVHGFGGDVERWAKEFDSPEREAWQKPDEVVALLQLATGMKVADIGAGTGYFEARLSRAVGPTGSVLALDVEDGMVQFLDARAKREGLANVRASKVAFDDPKLAAASVDRVLIVDTWHHIDGREAYSAKLRDALVPGGFVAIVDFTMEAKQGPPKEHRLLPELVKKELESAGLVGEIASETLPDQYVVLGRKAAK